MRPNSSRPGMAKSQPRLEQVFNNGGGILEGLSGEGSSCATSGGRGGGWSRHSGCVESVVQGGRCRSTTRS